MTLIQVIRIKKLTGKNIIQTAALHNHREIASELGGNSHIDMTKTRLNRVLRGADTAAGVANMAQELIDNAGIKTLRKDAVRALEIIFSLPPTSSIDHKRFFKDALDWIDKYFHAPVISAIIHNDEAAPHCHVLVLPLVRGRMIGSDLMGNRTKLQALQSDFHFTVGQPHGLARRPALKRHSAATRQKAIDSAFEVLEANSGLSAIVLQALLAPHMNDPAPLMLALGLTMPAEKVKSKDTFIEIMTRPCKPARKPIGFGMSNPIGFDDSAPAETEQTLSCVGFGESAPPISPTTAPIIELMTGLRSQVVPVVPMDEQQGDDDNSGDFIRERDADSPTELWDSDSGEFIKAPRAKTPARLRVIEAKSDRLSAGHKAR